MEALLVRAANPSPFTLGGTNTWVVGRDPAWVVDPGPALPEHLDAVAAAVAARGGAGGIALTHDHPDHADGLRALRARLGDPPVGRMPPLADGDAFGPFTALHVPGHAPDHLVFVADGVAFTGDAVLGAGSVFIAPGGGGLGPYLDGLRRLRALGLQRILPGHGPEVTDPDAKLDEYVAHRLERERRLLDALAAGGRTIDELLDAAWSDAPAILRPAATVTLAAHLDKLADEDRLPEGVERPVRPPWLPG
jgi:glyoxylase-like metal-dependent hydrolase (beta-lactamase superfamily II)